MRTWPSVDVTIADVDYKNVSKILKMGVNAEAVLYLQHMEKFNSVALNILINVF